MSYPDLELKVEKLRSDVCKIKERLYKLEDVRDEKEQVSADPSKLESNKDYALDWYINQYQNMCKEYNKVKIELDDKQKVLKLTIEQRDRYLDQIINQNSMIDALERDFRDSKKTNQRLRAFIKNHEDRILELEKEVEYHKAFGNSEKIRKLELDIKYLEDKNRFISDLNDEYRKMVVNDVNELQEIIEMIWEIKNPILSEEKYEIVEKINKMIRSMQGSE